MTMRSTEPYTCHCHDGGPHHPSCPLRPVTLAAEVQAWLASQTSDGAR